ncbi:unnamed protein product [Cylicocyclus nassatus]|uniref:Uncharacterized protein n=1 Tax=Cylicocyclus nassatus TaxID=53992 RepID=A0AA36MB02_CYLNA|nr:unnamed protein product [Cylicocyclus nassatus]
MLTILLCSWLIGVTAKSLSSPSETLLGSDKKANTPDVFKEPGAMDQEIPMNYSRTTFRFEYNDNGTEIIAPKEVAFEIIPVDYLCSFCKAIIEKLKIRQKEEAEFEKNMQDECKNSNHTSLDGENVCALINKVNLQRLQEDSAAKICAEEKLCLGKEEEQNIKEEEDEETEKKRPEPPPTLEKGKNQEAVKEEQEKFSKSKTVEAVPAVKGDEQPKKTDTGTPSAKEDASVLAVSGAHLDSSAIASSLDNAVNIASGRTGGVAKVSPNGRLYLDRTVQLKLEVEDPKVENR